MYDSILVPCDESKSSLNAVTHASELAQIHDSELILLHTVRREIVEDNTAMLERIGKKTLDRAEQAIETDVPVTRVVKRGSPHRVIVDFAKDEEVDLIIIGTHGRSGINRLLLGSVTESTIRHTETPVLTIH